MSELESILLCYAPDAAFLPVGISAELIKSAASLTKHVTHSR